jgi:hypothetical protein
LFFKVFIWNLQRRLYIYNKSKPFCSFMFICMWNLQRRFCCIFFLAVFQFSSSNDLEEVTKENFNKCNTTNVLRSYTNGNTTITLSKPGPRYFISGNKLYCLGGMKLQVNVENNQAYSPANAPQQDQGAATLPQPSTKSNINPTSGGVLHGGGDSLMPFSLAFMATAVLWVLQIWIFTLKNIIYIYIYTHTHTHFPFF